MRQEAVLTEVLDHNMAEVAVTRMTACGSSCSSCESCIYQGEIKTVARNDIDARPGDAVLIESKNSYVYKAAFLVYVIPIVLMILMYALGSLVFKSEGISIVCAFLGIILGGIVIVLTERRRKTAIDFSIVDFNEEKKFNG